MALSTKTHGLGAKGGSDLHAHGIGLFMRGSPVGLMNSPCYGSMAASKRSRSQPGSGIGRKVRMSTTTAMLRARKTG